MMLIAGMLVANVPGALPAMPNMNLQDFFGDSFSRFCIIAGALAGSLTISFVFNGEDPANGPYYLLDYISHGLFDEGGGVFH